MFKDLIQDFPKQLEYEPTIENSTAFHKKNKFIFCGTGGSNLSAGIIMSWKPKLDIIIHRDYGLPEIDELELKNYLVICSSYSGNTEEAISSFEEALGRKLQIIVISTGGKLIELAQKHGIPFIKFPEINNSPRIAIGYNIKAAVKAMAEVSLLNDIDGAIRYSDFQKTEQVGQNLAKQLQNRIVLIYSSGKNSGLARYLKISLNETAKVPAFYNFLPELNHNEMVGINDKIFEGNLKDKLAYIFLNDPDDQPKIQTRFVATKEMFQNQGFPVLGIDLSGPSLWHKSFIAISTAMWTSYYLAEYYGLDPEDISNIQDFKKSLTVL
ncbi:MAG TPA: SIS domain-containing protein [Candidatus Paceibacterota bacterium]